MTPGSGISGAAASTGIPLSPVVCGMPTPNDCVLERLLKALTELLDLNPVMLGEVETIRRALTIVREVWPCDDLHLLRVMQHDQRRTVFEKHFLNSDSGPLVFDTDKGINRFCVENRAYFVARSYDTERSLAHGYTAPCNRPIPSSPLTLQYLHTKPDKEASALFYPLMYHDSCVAVLKLCDYHRPERFGDLDAVTISPIAQGLANLLHLHAALVAVRTKNQEFETLVAEREHALDKLKIGERLTYQFLTATSHLHELAGVIAAMASDREGFISIVETSSLPQSERSELIQTIDLHEQHRKSAFKKVRELLETRPKKEQLFIKPHNIKALVDEQIDVYSRQLERDEIRIRKSIRSADTSLFVDESSFRYVLRILINNAVRALNRGPNRPKRLDIWAVRTEHTLELGIRDNGEGIEPEIQKSIFDAFFTTHEDGSGIGLFWAKKVIEEDHKGKIYISRSWPGRGTTFVIELPA